MSLRTVLGSRAPLLSEGPEVAAGIELESFFLFPDALEQFQPVRLDATFAPDEGPRGGLRAARRRGRGGRPGGRRDAARRRTPAPDRLPIPALLATGPSTTGSSRPAAAHEGDARRRDRRGARGAPLRLPARLRRRGDLPAPRARDARRSWPRRTRSAATAPRPPRRSVRFKHAIEDGVLKVMSKMGISDVASYCGAQIFERGRARPEIVDRRVRRDAVPDRRHRLRRARARDGRARIALAGGCEADSSRTRATSSGARAASRTRRTATSSTPCTRSSLPMPFAGRSRERRLANGLDGWDLYEKFAGLVNGRAPMEPRDLLELVPAGQPVPLEEVEPVEAILRALLGRRDVARRALGRGARDDRDRAQPARRQGELR